MELTELKSIWELISADFLTKHSVSEGIVIETIRKKSNTEISKIKRSMLWKLGLGALSTFIIIALLIVTIIESKGFKILRVSLNTTEASMFFGSLALSILVMLWFNYKAYRKIIRFQFLKYNLRESLQAVVDAMETAIKVNIYSDTVLTPIVITWLFYMNYYKNRPLEWNNGALYLILLPIAVGILVLYFQRFIQKVKFGNYVNNLKAYLESLKKED